MTAAGGFIQKPAVAYREESGGAGLPERRCRVRPTERSELHSLNVAGRVKAVFSGNAFLLIDPWAFPQYQDYPYLSEVSRNR
jgi:hypothetical protein